MKALVAITLGLVLSACGSTVQETSYPDFGSSVQSELPLLIIAHRGGMAYSPENTLLAFGNSVRIGADVVEMDTFVTAYGEAVVIHDASLERTTDCTGSVLTGTYSALTLCDAAYWWQPGADLFSAGNGGPLLRRRGVMIPLLSEVLGQIRETSADVMVELKNPWGVALEGTTAAPMDVLLGRLQGWLSADRVFVNAYDVRSLAYVESVWPDVATVLTWANSSKVTCLGAVRGAISANVDAIAIEIADLPQDQVLECRQFARDAGIQVFLWMVNGVETLERAIDLLPDGVITDYPACLNALLRDIRIRNPYPDAVFGGEYLPKCGR